MAALKDNQGQKQKTSKCLAPGPSASRTGSPWQRVEIFRVVGHFRYRQGWKALVKSTSDDQSAFNGGETRGPTFSALRVCCIQAVEELTGSRFTDVFLAGSCGSTLKFLLIWPQAESVLNVSFSLSFHQPKRVRQQPEETRTWNLLKFEHEISVNATTPNSTFYGYSSSFSGFHTLRTLKKQ